MPGKLVLALGGRPQFFTMWMDLSLLGFLNCSPAWQLTAHRVSDTRARCEAALSFMTASEIVLLFPQQPLGDTGQSKDVNARRWVGLSGRYLGGGLPQAPFLLNNKKKKSFYQRV